MVVKKRSADSDAGTRPSGALRVALIDDDYWTRTAMSTELDEEPAVDVILSLDQDEALGLSRDDWVHLDLDLAVVDVLDVTAPSRPARTSTRVSPSWS